MLMGFSIVIKYISFSLGVKKIFYLDVEISAMGHRTFQLILREAL